MKKLFTCWKFRGRAIRRGNQFSMVVGVIDKQSRLSGRKYWNSPQCQQTVSRKVANDFNFFKGKFFFPFLNFRFFFFLFFLFPLSLYFFLSHHFLLYLSCFVAVLYLLLSVRPFNSVFSLLCKIFIKKFCSPFAALKALFDYSRVFWQNIIYFRQFCRSTHEEMFLRWKKQLFIKK